MIFWIVSTILFLVLVGILLELVMPVPQTGTVEGRVTGSDVTNVTMTLDKNGVVASTLTDAEGHYAFDAVAIGEYTVKAHKDVPEGFLTGELYIYVSGGTNIAADIPLVRIYPTH